MFPDDSPLVVGGKYNAMIWITIFKYFWWFNTINGFADEIRML